MFGQIRTGCRGSCIVLVVRRVSLLSCRLCLWFLEEEEVSGSLELNGGVEWIGYEDCLIALRIGLG